MSEQTLTTEQKRAQRIAQLRARLQKEEAKQAEIRHHDCDYHASDVRDPGNLQPCGDCGKRKHRGSRHGRGDFQKR